MSLAEGETRCPWKVKASLAEGEVRYLWYVKPSLSEGETICLCKV